MDFVVPEEIKHITGFRDFSNDRLTGLISSMGLAISLEDILFCQDYFKNTEKRDPTVTEIKMLDTYWSDHCRHTTFNTRINRIGFRQGHFSKPIKQALLKFIYSLDHRFKGEIDEGVEFNPEGPDISLMKIATRSMHQMREAGKLDDMEISGEVNACSIIRKITINGKEQEWLIMFKNETHNHPTEIEPFGGAATCLGGAIRDPLSGRAYVYQAMRVTGSGDPRTPIEQTLPGKLPQKKITTEAAHGYSSYGNQIGLATGLVNEIYHRGYVSKRMEVGAVIGAVARDNVRREDALPGDVVVLVGGRTGRDGIGGATGSSKKHTEASIHTAGAEVQKGNPPEERKLQRLFRNPEVIRLIKKSNDFGAGGVSVAIGELADGLDIDLDRVPKKYRGLDGTELALSESQERMAVVLDESDAERFIGFAGQENLEATVIARVTSSNRLRMTWQKKTIVDISRDFIKTNGVRKETEVMVAAPEEKDNYFNLFKKEINSANQDIKKLWLNSLKTLNTCSQIGLVERFDSTIGAGTVLFPLGGIYQKTPVEAMVAKIPVLESDTRAATAMTFGFNPEMAMWSPYHAGLYSVVEAVARIVATGGDCRSIRFTLQEYFEKLGQDPEKWGKPFSALLGAYHALTELDLAAIGGKDSMSGSFENLHVPPTLIAFGVDVVDIETVISPEFKKPGSSVVIIRIKKDQYQCPLFADLKHKYAAITQNIKKGHIISAQSIRTGGIAVAISKMCFGNRIGFVFDRPMDRAELFSPEYGSMLLEIGDPENLPGMFEGINAEVLGHTREKASLEINNMEIGLGEMLEHWARPLETVFPVSMKDAPGKPRKILFSRRSGKKPAGPVAKPRVLIPVFPGINCEYDTGRAFEQAGGIVETMVFKNLTPSDINQSLGLLKRAISNSQIIVIPGGFSAGDEPDGSGKFIAAVFRNAEIREAIAVFLEKRDGLILGICNGYQALLKLGLLEHGEIRDMTENSPTLTYNTIGRHVSRMVRTKVVSVHSPWFLCCEPGEIHIIPVSHGEGRFVASQNVFEEMVRRGQIATQFVDIEGRPSLHFDFNPNGSMQAVEGITSPDGRILGKMAHSERKGYQICKNIPGNKDQKLFESGIKYFS